MRFLRPLGVMALSGGATAFLLGATFSRAGARSPVVVDDGVVTAPTLCPPNLPLPGINIALPPTVDVPKFDPNAPGRQGASTVPFKPTAYWLNPGVQPVLLGQGWYSPEQTTTTYNGLHYTWTGPGDEGALMFTCTEQTYFLLFIAITVTSTGNVWGFATVDPEEGTGTRSSGGGEAEPNSDCYELYEWWVDDSGYHEVILSSWCSPRVQ